MSHSDPQEKVFALLGDPATHGGAQVRRIDTHAASVFLAGDHAYKVKRAVRFPFLDYSTLAKRKAACDAELAVNRAFAPQIYRGVVPISRTDKGLALGGDGEPVEWAVRMRRFDENATLDRLADQGSLDLALADDLARVVAAAHARAQAADGRAVDRRAGAIYRTERIRIARLPPPLFALDDIDSTDGREPYRARPIAAPARGPVARRVSSAAATAICTSATSR